MSPKPVVPRVRAARDVDAAVAAYLDEGASAAALGFVDALESAFSLISEHPAVGRTAYAHVVNLPGLRSWTTKGFPYVIFYVERDDHVDVWRVLHGHRDLGSILSEPAD